MTVRRVACMGVWRALPEMLRPHKERGKTDRGREQREIKATAKDGRKLTCCLFLETQGVAGVKRGEGCENGALIREISAS